MFLLGWAEGTWICVCVCVCGVQTVVDKLNLRLSNCNYIAYFAFQSKDMFEKSSRTGCDYSSVNTIDLILSVAVLEGKSLELKSQLNNALMFWPVNQSNINRLIDSWIDIFYNKYVHIERVWLLAVTIFIIGYFSGLFYFWKFCIDTYTLISLLSKAIEYFLHYLSRKKKDILG